ncbi:unnamed protein product [Schistosoma mattheei]|uniref:Uncharacterized protein n=1 Tax=Schistosoma mattheei TaxID=31246 RepID=A0A183PYH9_9TREM|nr:unnamed protein product [Schistosoma mattheei]
MWQVLSRSKLVENVSNFVRSYFVPCIYSQGEYVSLYTLETTVVNIKFAEKV